MCIEAFVGWKCAPWDSFNCRLCAEVFVLMKSCFHAFLYNALNFFRWKDFHI